MKKSTLFTMAAALILGSAASVNAAETPAYTLSPEPGSIVDEITSIKITFPDTEVYFKEGTEDDPTILLNLADKEWICQMPEAISPAPEGGSAFNFNMTSDWDFPTYESGEYKLTVTNMFTTVDGQEVALDPIVAYYTIPYPYAYSFTPSVDEATDLQGLELNFPDLCLTFYENMQLGIATLSAPNTVYECRKPERTYSADSGTTFKFMFSDTHAAEDPVPETITSRGTYLLTIRGIYMTDEAQEDFGQNLPLIYVYYTIPAGGGDDGPDTPVYYMDAGKVIDPEGTYVSGLYSLIIDFNTPRLELVDASEPEEEWETPESNIKATLTISGYDEKFELPTYVFTTLPEGPRDGEFDDEGGDMATYDMLIIDMPMEEFDWEMPYGTYTITLPAGVVKDELGAINPQQVFTYHVLEADWTEPDVTPAPFDDNYDLVEYLASELNNIEISWGETLVYNDRAPLATIAPATFWSADPGTPIYYGQGIRLSEDDSAILLDLSEVEAGSWQVYVPEAYVFIGEDKQTINAEFYLQYLIVDKKSESGISGLQADEQGLFRVFDLKGVNVANTTNVDDIRALDPGIYVINGVKVLIRR